MSSTDAYSSAYPVLSRPRPNIQTVVLLAVQKKDKQEYVHHFSSWHVDKPFPFSLDVVVTMKPYSVFVGWVSIWNHSLQQVILSFLLFFHSFILSEMNASSLLPSSSPWKRRRRRRLINRHNYSIIRYISGMDCPTSGACIRHASTRSSEKLVNQSFDCFKKIIFSFHLRTRTWTCRLLIGRHGLIQPLLLQR